VIDLSFFLSRASSSSSSSSSTASTYQYTDIVMGSADLKQNVRAVLENTIKAPGGPPGIVFGAVDRTGKILVNESAGVRFIDRPDEKVRFSSWGTLNGWLTIDVSLP
jgi:hypothetical protein